MLIKIHVRGFSLSDALREYSDSKVRLALGLYKEKIQRIDIFLADVNGPKGGEDMSCKVKVILDNCRPLIIHEMADDMYVAINVCSHRVKRTVGRHLGRVFQKRKQYFEFAGIDA